tara:strand:- start:1826 stop:3055 length:1230 start_codon:yes stop_codon:yes gene_type:complete
MTKITLRKFPFPYCSALAIANDLDNTISVKTYFTMMDYLNGTSQTHFGCGLGLEIGNSFWFFNGTQTPQVSYFSQLTQNETSFSGPCRELWESGHIDTLHTFGNFDDGRFHRKYAEIAINELQRYGAKIPVWINHGTKNNTQNIGADDSFQGAVRDANVYHMDIVRDAGCRYYWVGRMTHVIGQNAKRNVNILSKTLLQNVINSVKYSSINASFLSYPDNQIMHPSLLQDGSQVWDFQRWINAWGRETLLDIHDFIIQINPSVIKTLIRNEGMMVLYTHFNENLIFKEGIPQKLQIALQNIKMQFESGKLLVSTVARLLNYIEVSTHISFNTLKQNNKTIIILNPKLNTPLGNRMLTLPELTGLTFYYSSDIPPQISFMGKEIQVSQNTPDKTKKKSISIPWKQLEYPN